MVKWVRGIEGCSNVVQSGFSGRLGDEGLIWKRFGKFWSEVGRGGERWEVEGRG